MASRASLAVLPAETFWTFRREFSPPTSVIAQDSGSRLLGLRLLSAETFCTFLREFSPRLL